MTRAVMSESVSIAFVNSTTISWAFAEAIEDLEAESQGRLKVAMHYAHDLEAARESEQDFVRALKDADVVLLDLRGGGQAVRLAAEALGDTDKTCVVLVGGGAEIMSLCRMGSFHAGKIFAARPESAERELSWDNAERIAGLVERLGRLFPFGAVKHARNWVLAMKYWRYGGAENLKNLLRMIAREYAGVPLEKPAPPVEFPDAAIYHPVLEKTFPSLDAYWAEKPPDPAKPTLGMLFYGGMHFESCILTARAIAERLEREANLLPVYADGSFSNLDAVRTFFFRGDRPVVDGVLRMMWFRLNGGPRGGDPQETLDLLQQLDAPVFLSCPMFRQRVDAWRESSRGFSLIEVITAVIYPELDGGVEPIPTGGVESMGFCDGLAADVRSVAPIPDRVEKAAARALNWARLRRKPPGERRVAIILYDYPPGEDNIGNAAYLDVFKSVERLLERLRDAGYAVAQPPPGKLHEAFLELGLVNSGKWTSKTRTAGACPGVDAATYERWLRALPNPDEIAREWGEPPGEVMTHDGRLLIPGLELGNVFIGLQPSRGIHEDPEKAYHDKTLPPHHQYIAFYRWLQDVWRADVCIHVGTHGTLEFTKGKEVGLSGECYPDLLIGAMPHLYIYHVTNASEAMIAKRRSLATIVNYHTPAFAAAGLYDEYAELDALVAEYHEAETQDPLRAKRLVPAIRAKAEEAHFESDDIDAIHAELFRMKRRIMPCGLHVLGEPFDRGAVVDFITFLLRYDRAEAPSAHRLLVEARGADYDAALRDPGGSFDGLSHAELLQQAEAECRRLVEAALESPDSDPAADARLPDAWREGLRRSLRFGFDVAKRLGEADEIGSLMHGLDGGFILPNIGGDPIRTPDALPSGRNTYQFDPRQTPSDSACERGAQIAENTLQRYRAAHGRHPESVGVILWGFETTKTRGETVGQILHYIGVRLVRRRSQWTPALEAVPRAELCRPRIDVVVNMCGFFRDLFPNLVELLDQAFNLVAELDEPEEANFVRRHSRAAFEEIRAEVEDDLAARRLANARVFGPRAGEYGTRVRGLIETSHWEEEAQLGEAFIGSLNHVYGEHAHAERMDALYRRALSHVEVVSQVRDTHEYEIADLDHYYEYFGGLAKAVEIVSGRKPEMLISDTTTELIQTEDVADALRRGVRTRLLNPAWIDAMLEHEYHGAQKIADRVEYQIGFAATTNKVDNWIWSEIAARYIFDEQMRRRLMENNRYAAAEIVERLFEAERRGYWDATDEERRRLEQAYLEIEGWIEERQ